MKKRIKLKESDLKRMISKSVKRALNESAIPDYENPVFIECNSEDDADVCVELGYSDYSSSRFYVGGCGTDAYAALAVVVEYLADNGIIDRYAYDEEDLEAYDIDDFIEVEGYYLPSWLTHIEQVVGNHGERPGSLSESIRRNVRRVLNEEIDSYTTSLQEAYKMVYQVYRTVTNVYNSLDRNDERRGQLKTVFESIGTTLSEIKYAMLGKRMTGNRPIWDKQ